MNLNKKSIFHYMIFGNKLVIMCVFFTIATILDIIICAIFRLKTSTTFVHLIDRMVLCVITIPPLSLFKYFEKLSVWVILPIHYTVCCILSLLYTYIHGFYRELHPDAYLDMFRSVTIMYVVFVIGALIIDLTRTTIANKELNKIQSSAQNKEK